jgi:hypothetical protein
MIERKIRIYKFININFISSFAFPLLKYTFVFKKNNTLYQTSMSGITTVAHGSE